MKTTAGCCSKKGNCFHNFVFFYSDTENTGKMGFINCELLCAFSSEVELFEKSMETNCHIDVRHHESQ